MALCGIPDSGRLAAILAGLEFDGLLCLMRLAGKSPEYASLKSGHSHHGIGPACEGIYLESMPLLVRQIPGHIYHYFPGQKWTSKRHEGLHIEKKTFSPQMTAPPRPCYGP